MLSMYKMSSIQRTPQTMGLSRWLFKALAKWPNRVSFTISKKCKKKKKKKRKKGEKRLSLAQHVLLPNTIEPADIYSWLSKAPKREIYNQKRSKENLIGEEMNKIVLFGRLTRYSLIHETRMEATQNVKEN